MLPWPLSSLLGRTSLLLMPYPTFCLFRYLELQGLLLDQRHPGHVSAMGLFRDHVCNWLRASQVRMHQMTDIASHGLCKNRHQSSGRASAINVAAFETRSNHDVGGVGLESTLIKVLDIGRKFLCFGRAWQKICTGDCAGSRQAEAAGS